MMIGDDDIDGGIDDGCHDNNDNDVHDGDIDEDDGSSRKMAG